MNNVCASRVDTVKCCDFRLMILAVGFHRGVISGGEAAITVAGPLAARGGGQICRPFVLGFGNWSLKYKSHVMSTVTSLY